MKQEPNYYCLTRPEIACYVPKATKRILDIGCSEGFFLKLVKEQTGAETWGIEIEEEVAEKAKGKVDNLLTGRIEDLLHLLPNEYFDCITFNDVLEHLTEPKDVLIMIKSKISKNGIVISSVPNVRYFDNLKELIIKKDWEYKDSGILDSTHFRFFTKKSMKRMFEKAGFVILNQIGIHELISLKFRLFNILTVGFFSDSKYLQFVCILKIRTEK